MKKYIWMIGVWVGIMVLSTGVARAQMGPPPPDEQEWEGPPPEMMEDERPMRHRERKFSKEEMMDRMEQRMAEELGLSDEQRAALKANREAHRDEVKDLRDKIKAKHKELAQALKAADVSRESVQGIVAELKDLQGQTIEARINGIFEVKEILTPEQFAQFQEKAEGFMEKRRERRKENMGDKGERKTRWGER